MTADIRLACADDLAGIAPLQKSTQETDWPQALMLECIEKGQCWLACQGGLIVAFAVFNRVLDEAELLNIAVLPQQRRYGLAGGLIREVLANFAADGIRRCFLEVAAGNSGARALYEKLGFVTVTVRKNYYQHDSGSDDALVMRLDL